MQHHRHQSPDHDGAGTVVVAAVGIGVTDDAGDDGMEMISRAR
jgi:hypothetical protein